MSEIKFLYDTVALDRANMVETDEELVFKDVVLAREIVQPYEDGMAYKPADELEAYYWTAEGRWATSGNHPMLGIITKRDEIHGKTTNVRFIKNLKDPKTKRPMMRGVLGDLHVFKKMVSPSLIEDMKSMRKPSVSIGFFYKMDHTPGQWNGDSYDYVQRNMMHDHLAFGIDAGRCPWPQCGIGADELIHKAQEMTIAGDPFADFENFSDCVKQIMKDNPDYTKEQAAATCAKIEKRSKEKDNTFLREIVNMQPSTEETLTSALRLLIKDVLTDILNKNVEPSIDESMTEVERAMSHFGLTEEEWGALSPEEKQTYIDKLPEKGSGGEEEEEEKEEDSPCTDCDDEETIETPILENDEEEEEEEPEPDTSSNQEEKPDVDIVKKAKEEIEKTKEFLHSRKLE